MAVGGAAGSVGSGVDNGAAVGGTAVAGAGVADPPQAAAITRASSRRAEINHLGFNHRKWDILRLLEITLMFMEFVSTQTQAKRPWRSSQRQAGEFNLYGGAFFVLDQCARRRAVLQTGRVPGALAGDDLKPVVNILKLGVHRPNGAHLTAEPASDAQVLIYVNFHGLHFHGLAGDFTAMT
jgi:hypothetical protein